MVQYDIIEWENMTEWEEIVRHDWMKRADVIGLDEKRIKSGFSKFQFFFYQIQNHKTFPKSTASTYTNF